MILMMLKKQTISIAGTAVGGGKAAMERRIVVIKYGESVFNESYIFRGGSPERMLPISFVIYLIQDGARNILVDAGCNDGAGFDMTIFSKPADIVKAYGLMPEDITDIVITHHHHDHIEAVKDYPNAIIHMQKEEYELGKTYIPQKQKVELFDEEKLLAEGLVVKKIGGHSVGSSIVLCNCNSKRYLLCGDECYVKDCIVQHVPTGSSYDLAKSEQFVRNYSDGQYEFLLFHDAEIMKGRIGCEII